MNQKNFLRSLFVAFSFFGGVLGFANHASAEWCGELRNCCNSQTPSSCLSPNPEQFCRETQDICSTALNATASSYSGSGYSCAEVVACTDRGGAAAQDGQCGSASGTTSQTAPSSDLCAVGSPSGVINFGSQWEWTCSGTNGGSTGSCSAPVKGGSQGCSYMVGSVQYGEGTCTATSSCTSTFKGSSSDCASGEICCGGGITASGCSFTQNGQQYDGTCQNTCSNSSLPSGSSSECGSGETCCDGVASSSGGTSTSDDEFCSSGLVPCGRNCDNPKTEIREDQMCTLCHLFAGFQNIISWGMMILTFFALAALTAAGILYLMSAGNQSMMENAKQFMKNTLLGFFLVLIAWVIINTVILLIGGKLENVEKSDSSWWKISCSYERSDSTGTTTTGTSTTNSSNSGSTTGTASGSGTVTSSGSASNGDLTITPGRVTFTDVPLGQASKSVTITVENTATFTSVPIQNVSVMGQTSGGQYIIGNQTCPVGGVLSAGETCTFTVTFQSSECVQEYGANLSVQFLGSSSTPTTVTTRASATCASGSGQ